jgi:hypothetical protein
VSRACSANTAPPPPTDRGIVGWCFGLLQREYRPCGSPATHVTADGQELCVVHAEALRVALADPLTAGNVILGRARTPIEIKALVRDLS